MGEKEGKGEEGKRGVEQGTRNLSLRVIENQRPLYQEGILGEGRQRGERGDGEGGKQKRGRMKEVDKR